jgi:ribosomal protein L12E/L44/L45/RPP1/RPP2
MASPAYDPEEIDALARVLARAALDELIRETTSQGAAQADAAPAVECFKALPSLTPEQAS